MMSFGPRSTLGLFLTPQSQANGWGRDVFGLALAIQNILWGLGQPFAGVLADRFGVVARAVRRRDPLRPRPRHDGAGDDAAAARPLGRRPHRLRPRRLLASAIVMAAFGKLCRSAGARSRFGAGAAAGSFGQFLYSPLTVSLMDAVGWQDTLRHLRGGHAAGAAALARARPPAGPQTGAQRTAQQSLSQALSEAFAHRSYVLLVLGFFTCGFQLAFITVHLPAYLVDRGLSADVGGWTIAVIGLFNIIGSLDVGLARQLRAQALHPVGHLFRPRLGGAGLHLVSGDAAVGDHVRRRDGIVLAVDGAADQRDSSR